MSRRGRVRGVGGKGVVASSEGKETQSVCPERKRWGRSPRSGGLWALRVPTWHPPLGEVTKGRRRKWGRKLNLVALVPQPKAKPQQAFGDSGVEGKIRGERGCA